MGTEVPATEIGADNATLIKSAESCGGTVYRAPKHSLAAAERPFWQNNPLIVVATLEMRDQKKSQPTFKCPVDAGKRKSSITQFEHYVSLL